MSSGGRTSDELTSLRSIGRSAPGRGLRGVPAPRKGDRRVFRPVTNQRSSVQVADEIRRAITDGTYGPGCRLPSERELAAAFGVSRTTVREALKSLASLGFLEIRQGTGTMVSPQATTLEDPAYWLPWLQAHHEDVLALLDVREALEAKSASLAARAVARARPGAAALLGRIEENLDLMAGAAERLDVITLERLDLEFHALLAELSGNRHLLRLSKSINHVLNDRRAAMAIPGRARQSHLEHGRIVAAVGAGRPAEAARAMTRHLASTRRSITALRTKNQGEGEPNDVG